MKSNFLKKQDQSIAYMLKVKTCFIENNLALMNQPAKAHTCE